MQHLISLYHTAAVTIIERTSHILAAFNLAPSRTLHIEQHWHACRWDEQRLDHTLSWFQHSMGHIRPQDWACPSFINMPKLKILASCPSTANLLGVPPIACALLYRSVYLKIGLLDIYHTSSPEMKVDLKVASTSPAECS